MFTYSLSFWVHVSGPIAVVVEGLLIGNPRAAFRHERQDARAPRRVLADARRDPERRALPAARHRGLRRAGRRDADCRGAAGRADDPARAADLGDVADHGDEPARSVPARSGAGPHLERPARRHLGGDGAVPAAVSRARVPARRYLRRGGVSRSWCRGSRCGVCSPTTASASPPETKGTGRCPSHAVSSSPWLLFVASGARRRRGRRLSRPSSRAS